MDKEKKFLHFIYNSLPASQYKNTHVFIYTMFWLHCGFISEWYKENDGIRIRDRTREFEVNTDIALDPVACERRWGRIQDLVCVCVEREG